MTNPKRKPHGRNATTLFTHHSEPQRLEALYASGLLDVDRTPVFDEATQTAAHFLSMPICILGVMDSDRHCFKSAVGLSRIGLMNELAVSRQLPRTESLCHRVVETQRPVMIADTTLDPVVSASVLVQRYGIRAYLGVPLFNSQGQCLGSLAVMELAPRQFSPKDTAFLELMARWSMSEYERDRLLSEQVSAFSTEQAIASPPSQNNAVDSPALHNEVVSIKSDLLTQMTQDLRTPLTSVLGMTSVLKQEIYGKLTEKQHEYIDVVHASGQHLLALVNEILDVGSLEAEHSSLNPVPVDVEMLCQQVMQALDPAAQRYEQELQLTVEPGNRIWCLDKDKSRQMLYHLIAGLVQSSNPGSTIRIHVSRKHQQLHIAIWTSHPWLDEGAQSPYRDELLDHPSVLISDMTSLTLNTASRNRSELKGSEPAGNRDRHQLGLKLSQQLAALHGGEIKVQDTSATGSRYVVILPQLALDSGAS